MKTYPLIQSQLGMYLDYSREPDSIKYNIAICFRIAKDIDKDRLLRAIKSAAEQMEVFHLRFCEVDGGVRQFLSDDEIVVGSKVISDQELEDEQKSFVRPIDPFREANHRFCLLETPTSLYLLACYFHLFIDGTTISIFHKLISRLYENPGYRSNELVSFLDYTELEPLRFQTAEYREAARALREKFSGLSMTSPVDYWAEAGESNNGTEFFMASEYLECRGVEEFCRMRRIHPNQFFLGAFALTLSCFTPERKVVFTTTYHGRRTLEQKNMSGPLVMLHPVLGEINGEMSLGQFLESFRLHKVGVCPFTHLSRDFGLGSGFSLSYQEGVSEEIYLGGSKTEKWQFLYPGGTGENVHIEVYDRGKQYFCEISCLPGKYSRTFIEQFLKLFTGICKNFLCHPEARLKNIPVLLPEDIPGVLALSKGEDLPYDLALTFPEQIRRRAEKRPDDVAVVDCETELTYGEFERRTNILAHTLRSVGVSPGKYVGLMLSRRISFPIGALAVQKAGAGYIPLDAEYPDERLAYMLENSGARVLITNRALLAEKRLVFSGTTVLFDEVDFSESQDSSPVRLDTRETPAYMIYTSGSTGRPKGVVISQGSLTAMTAWYNQKFAEPGDRNIVGCQASFSFDASVISMFPALAAGGTVHIFSEELRKDLEGMYRYVCDNHLVGMNLSTQIGLALLNAYPDIPLTYLKLGGEKIMRLPRTSVKVYNAYGPTEFTVESSYHLLSSSEDDIPIGRPVPNSYSFIVNQLGQLLPAGFGGELALAGPQVGKGYWQLPDKTATAFISCPVLPGQTMYRTGDMAKYNRSRELVFLGRLDSQVKLRGYRIEIGEIEYAASGCPGVRRAAAEVRELSGISHLVLYYEGRVEAKELKARLSRHLAEYMVPEYYVAIEQMPLTPNGKIDRQKLPLPEYTPEEIVLPANEPERQFWEVAAGILGRRDFGVTQNLVSCGLTSLGAMTMAAKLKTEWGISCSVRKILEQPDIRSLAAASAGGQTGNTAKNRRPARSWYPLTENQRGIYADWLRNHEASQYNVPVVLRFTREKSGQLVSALEKVLAAHPVLTTRFAEKEGEVVQLRRPGAVIPIVCETLEKNPDQEFFRRQVKPFALQDDDLVRVKIYTAPDGTYLFADAHHIIFDGISLGIMLSELKQTLAGREPSGENYTAYDYALEEREYLESEQLAADDEWFDRYLAGTTSTVFPDSASGHEATPGKAASQEILVDSSQVLACCARQGVTANDYFLTVLTELLYRIVREDKILISTVTSGRGRAETSQSVGMFVRTLPLRNIEHPMNFTEALQKMHAAVLDLLERENYSFVRLAERHGLRPGIMFAYEGGLFQPDDGVKMSSPGNAMVKFPLAITVMPEGERFRVAVEYDASRYSGQDMCSLLGMYRNLALGFCACDNLKDVPLLCGPAFDDVMALCRGPRLEYDSSQTFVQQFTALARRRPEKTAVVDKEGRLTYGELALKSDILAGKLLEAGIEPGRFVSLMLPRRSCFLVSVLAVQKAGAGYVPLDAEYPDERLSYMLDNSESPILITTREILTRKKLDFPKTVLIYEELEAERISSAGPIDMSCPEGPAYMIYTSGSTGKPKGVVISHRALAAILPWCREAFHLEDGARAVGHPSFSFDGSVMMMFPTLASGGEFHILWEEIRHDLPGMYDYIKTNGILQGAFSTQIGLELFNAFPDIPIKYVMLGGEKILPCARNNVQIINGYGPTEFTVCSSYYLVNQDLQEDIPVGRAVPNTYSFLTDRYGHILPQGYIGEIALAGAQLADGYWHLPDKTEAVFVDCPQLPGQKMYRTGDLGRYRDDGQLNYLGRLDYQVKLRGYRIEFGEIENCAAAFPGVLNVAAEVKEVQGNRHLVMYYCGDGQIDEGALKASLEKTLTSYMVPDYFVRLEQMPRTPNGKIDRRKLPSPVLTRKKREYAAPVTRAETTICKIFGEILDLAEYGATDDFFASGGTSILAIRAIVSLQKAGLSKVVYADIFKHKTPRALAAFLSGSPVAAEQPQQTFNFADYDYAAIDRLLQQTGRELFEDFELQPLGGILLTGATGYLGMHILKYLLESTDEKIYALIRQRHNLPPERRLLSTYVFYFGELPPEDVKQRVVCVEGDITDSDLSGKLEKFAIGTVINCAAIVKHYVADDAIDRVNVGGVKKLIDYCRQSGARLIHTSTYSIGGTVDKSSQVVLDEQHLFVGQDSDNDYVRTKFLAERCLLEAIAAGTVKGKIMRLGNLMGREYDGEFQMNIADNAFVNSLKSYRALGVFPLENLVTSIEMSPIDRVAEAIVRLAATPDDMVIFQPSNTYRLDLGAVMGAMNRRGWAIDYVSRQEFSAQVEELRNDTGLSQYLQGILHYTGHVLRNRKVTVTNNDWTTTVLYRLGFRWKQPDDKYLDRFLESLEGLGVFEINSKES